MSSGKPKRFNGQQWMEQLIRQRTNAALAGLPPAERRLRHDENASGRRPYIGRSAMKSGASEAAL